MHKAFYDQDQDIPGVHRPASGRASLAAPRIFCFPPPTWTPPPHPGAAGGGPPRLTAHAHPSPCCTGGCNHPQHHTHGLIYSYTHILIDSYTHILIYSYTHFLMSSCAHVLIHSYRLSKKKLKPSYTRMLVIPVRSYTLSGLASVYQQAPYKTPSEDSNDVCDCHQVGLEIWVRDWRLGLESGRNP